MTLNSFIITGGAIATVVAGFALYATHEIDSISAMRNGDVHTLSDRAAPQGILMPPPQIRQTAGVRLPSMADPAPRMARVTPINTELGDPSGRLAHVDTSEIGLPCELTVTAVPLDGAMVAIDVLAPCATDTGVVISHAGLELEATTDAMGLLTLDFPGFDTPALFTVRLADGRQETVATGLPDLYEFDRIGVSGHGARELGLAGLPLRGNGAAADGQPLEDGFVTTFGSEADYAEIYTLPRGTIGNGENIYLAFDEPATPNICDLTLEAQIFRAEGGAPVRLEDLTVSLPGCGESDGNLLVLQNVLEQLTVASN